MAAGTLSNEAALPKKRVGQVIVEALEEAGAKRRYGIPEDTLSHITGPLPISGKQAGP